MPDHAPPAEKLAPSPLLTSLREATQSLHRDVEQQIDFKRVTTSLPDYRRLLRVHAAVFAPLEDQLSKMDLPTAGGLRPPAPLHRSRQIAEDLRQTAGDEPDADAQQVEHCDGPRLNTVAEAVGAMYVIEGSLLGGQMIAKAVEQGLHLDATHGLAFFTGLGPDTRQRWNDFLRWSEAVLPEPPQHVEASDTARDVFASFLSTLCSATASQ